jgi:hypothetical protein
VAFGRLNESRCGAPKGERAAISAQPHPSDAAIGWMRLSALRFPFFFVARMERSEIRERPISVAVVPHVAALMRATFARISSSTAIAGEVRHAQHGG